jgi:hypothetical protein
MFRVDQGLQQRAEILEILGDRGDKAREVLRRRWMPLKELESQHYGLQAIECLMSRSRHKVHLLGG